MRDYILEISRDLCRDNRSSDIDEIAGVAGLAAADVLEYFPSYDALRTALGERTAKRDLGGK